MKLIIPKIIQRRAPLWTERLKTETRSELEYTLKQINGRMLDMQVYPTCLVGESRNFSYYNKTSDDDYCKTCIAYADCFDYLLTGAIPSTATIKLRVIPKTFQQALNRFAIHLKSHEAHRT